MSGRTALVTGASRGIGRACAEHLDRLGYRLLLTARSSADLEHVRQRLTEPDRHYLWPADLTVEQDITNLVQAVYRHWDQLDLLVLNAGIADNIAIEDTDVDSWDRIFAVNVRAPFLLVKGLLPALRREPGRIIVIGSVVSTAAYPHQGAYVASKHALHGFSRVLARELHTQGVIVQTIRPGGVATDMVHRVRPDIDASQLVAPEEVARAMEFLLSQQGNGITDEILIRRRGKEPET